jgi:Ribonuclease G/E
MSKELVISSNRHETKVAILEEDQLVEIYFQCSNEYSLAGSIHKGRVTRVLPGMQSAFVDLGLERDTFLYVSDFFEESEEYDRIPTGLEARNARADERSSRADERSSRGEERGSRGDRGALAEGIDRPAIEIRPALARLEAGPLSDEPSGPESAETSAGQPSSGPRSPSAGNSESERDQRGRRSRRRRNRGRGFPDSKYASDAQSSTSADLKRASDSSRNEGSRNTIEVVPQSDEGDSTPASSEEELIDYEFPVLPGETLAKYRQPPARLSPEPIRALEEPGQESSEPQAYTSSGAAPAKDQADIEPRSGDNGLKQLDEQIEESAEQQQPEAVAASEIISETREGSYTLEEIADSELPSAAFIEISDIEKSTTEDRSLSQPEEGLQRPQSSSELDPSEVEQGKPDADIVPGHLSANVREQGGRYMHRMPRRMRRKMRGDGRPSPETRPVALSQTDVGQALDLQPAMGARQEDPRMAVRPEKTPTTPSITDLLKEGQEILVQIAKEPLGQ